MIGIGRFKVKITSSFDGPNEYLIISVGRQDTIDDIVELCLRNMMIKPSKKAILVLQSNDSIDMLKYATISLDGNELEYAALGELEDGTKVILVPVVLGDNGIEFVRTYFKAGL